MKNMVLMVKILLRNESIDGSGGFREVCLNLVEERLKASQALSLPMSGSVRNYRVMISQNINSD